jgi:hypothetical protein
MKVLQVMSYSIDDMIIGSETLLKTFKLTSSQTTYTPNKTLTMPFAE